MACVSLASGVGGFAFGARKAGERSLLIDYLALLFAIPAAFAADARRRLDGGHGRAGAARRGDDRAARRGAEPARAGRRAARRR